MIRTLPINNKKQNDNKQRITSKDQIVEANKLPLPQRCFYKVNNEIILAIISQTNKTLDHLPSWKFYENTTTFNLNQAYIS